MSDRETQELLRQFVGGDQAAGASLATALIRAQSLFVAVAHLSPSLQGALGELAGEIDLNDLADKIDMTDLAGEIDLSELAGNIDASDLAGDIEASDIAEHIDFGELVSELSGEVDLLDLASEIDLGELATLVAAKLEGKLTKLVSEAVEKATG